MATDSHAAHLYGLARREFTEERDRLVSRLRQEGKEEEAARVAEMRKPTTDAWALNQVARRHPERVEALIDAHRALRQATDRDALGQASTARRQHVDEIMAAAVSALEEAGHSSAGSVRDRIARTLLAAATDPDAEQALRRGTLQRAVETAPAWPGEFTSSLPSTPRQHDSAHQEEIERLEVRAQELADRATQLRRGADRAKRALEEARRIWEEANRAARSAEGSAKEARQAADAARRGRGRDA